VQNQCSIVYPLATPHADTPYEKRRHWI